MLALLPAEETKSKFGEEIANKFYEYAKELKAKGIAIVTAWPQPY